MDARVTKVTKKKTQLKYSRVISIYCPLQPKKCFIYTSLKKKKKMSINLHSLFLFAWHGERGRRGYR